LPTRYVFCRSCLNVCRNLLDWYGDAGQWHGAENFHSGQLGPLPRIIGGRERQPGHGERNNYENSACAELDASALLLARSHVDAEEWTIRLWTGSSFASASIIVNCFEVVLPAGQERAVSRIDRTFEAIALGIQHIRGVYGTGAPTLQLCRPARPLPNATNARRSSDGIELWS
jgi:hypothetical protein